MTKFTIPTSKCKHRVPLVLLLFSAIVSAQVGINTTEPEATLDVNGTVRIQDIPTQSGNFLLTVNDEGHVSKFRSYLLYDVKGAVAENPVSRTLTGNETMNNIDLGLSTTLVIPPDVEAKVIINYSVPVGTELNQYPPSTYVGLTFLKGGAEMPSGSRKVTLISEDYEANNAISNMNTISNVYIETFAPSSLGRLITYEVRGYIEQHVDSGSNSYDYKFSMWDSTGPNYNWGKATLTSQIYIK